MQLQLSYSDTAHRGTAKTAAKGQRHPKKSRPVTLLKLDCPIRTPGIGANQRLPPLEAKGLRLSSRSSVQNSQLSSRTPLEIQPVSDPVLNFFNATQASGLISIRHDGIVVHHRIQKKDAAVIAPHHSQEVHLQWIGTGGVKSARAANEHCPFAAGFPPVGPYVQAGVHHPGTTMPAAMPQMLGHPLVVRAPGVVIDVPSFRWSTVTIKEKTIGTSQEQRLSWLLEPTHSILELLPLLLQRRRHGGKERRHGPHRTTTTSLRLEMLRKKKTVAFQNSKPSESGQFHTCFQLGCADSIIMSIMPVMS